MTTKLLEKLSQITSVIDRCTEYTGRLTSWLVLVLVLLVSYDVTMRYLFQSGSIAIQEMEWHLFSLIFLLGAAYTFKHDEHVRLDLVYQSRIMNDYRRAWVNLLGGLIFLIPFCILVITSSWPFVQSAYIHGEISADPGGLQYRWLIKSAIPLAFVLLALQGVSSVVKSLLHILDKSR